MRVLAKISGEALSRGSGGVFSDAAITSISNQLLHLVDHGYEVVVVVGGGNILRGSSSSGWQIDRTEADYVGMLGTIANGILIRAKVEALSKVEVRLMSAVDVPQVGENYVRRRAMRHLERKRLVLLCGGIGQPFVTTDYPAVQRAVELKCELVLAFKNGVSGVYDRDPRTDSAARMYRTISIEKAVAESLGFMDRAALVLAQQQNVCIHVIGADDNDAAIRAIKGEPVGTRVSKDCDTVFY
jgi:uridylate kinase